MYVSLKDKWISICKWVQVFSIGNYRINSKFIWRQEYKTGKLLKPEFTKMIIPFFFFKYFAGKMDSDVKSAYIQGTFNTTHWVLDNQQLLPFTHWGSGEPRLQYPGFVNIKVSKVSGNYYWQTAKGLRPMRHVFCGIIV